MSHTIDDLSDFIKMDILRRIRDLASGLRDYESADKIFKMLQNIPAPKTQKFKILRTKMTRLSALYADHQIGAFHAMHDTPKSGEDPELDLLDSLMGLVFDIATEDWNRAKLYLEDDKSIQLFG